MAKSTNLTHGEKRLLLGIGLFAALLLGVIAWRAVLEINPVITVPTPALPRHNALDTYVQAGGMVNTLTVTDSAQHATFGVEALGQFLWADAPAKGGTRDNSPAVIATPTWQDVETFSRGLGPAFTLLHRGFTLDCHDIPVRSIQQFTGQGDSTYDRIYALARALAIAGRVKMRHGDWNGAMANELDALQLGEEVQHGSGLNCTGGRCQFAGRREVWTVLPHLTAPQARDAIRRLITIMARTPCYVDLLREEKNAQLAMLNEILHKREWRQLFFGNASVGADYVSLCRFSMYSKYDVLRYWVRSMDKGIANAGKPYSATNTLPSRLRNPLVLPCLMNGFMSNLARCFVTVNETQNALLLTGCALQAYHAEHGHYPDTLRELTPAYLPAVPVDPFGANKPLCYKRTDTRYLLYSIGPDGIDDGGKASDDGKENAIKCDKIMRFYSMGDIVAGVNVQE